MPRQTHGQPKHMGKIRPTRDRKLTGNRTLDAFAIAQHELPTQARVRASRLGEIDEADQRLHAGKQQAHLERPAKRIRTQRHRSSDSDDSRGDESGENTWHVGVEEGDADSELDSDEAMGESDEAIHKDLPIQRSDSRSSTRPRNKGQTKGVKDLDLDERFPTQIDGERGSSDGNVTDEDALDLVTALDQHEERIQLGQSHRNGSVRRKGNGPRKVREEINDNDIDDDASTSEDELSTLSVSDDEAAAADDNRLKSFIQGLEEQERSDPSSTTSIRPLAIGEPSDYGLAPSQKLTIADLMPTVTDPRLRASLKMLHNDDQRGSKKSTNGMLGKLDPPLPKRQQDKLDREAAYKKSKETLGRWVDTVKQNRRAEHISFPVSDSAATSGPGAKQLLPISESECVTPLESTIQNILHESGLVSANDASGEKALMASEELEERHMPIEQVQVRRAELRRARELMFREEVRARRIKKIKSKAYRRVHRKERDKYTQVERGALAAAGALDSEGERERHDRQRAEERMGHRHKTSRWAKAVQVTGRAVWDEEARLGVNDMASRDEALRRRVEGREINSADRSDANTADDESSSDISIDEYDEIRDQKLKQQLESLKSEEPPGTAPSGLSAMSFMRKAESSHRAANQAEITQTRRLLADDVDDASNLEEDQDESRGRQKFGIGQQRENAETPLEGMVGDFEEPMSEGEAQVEGPAADAKFTLHRESSKKEGAIVKPVKRKHSRIDKDVDASTNASNPWLSGLHIDKSQRRMDEPLIVSRTWTQNNNKHVEVSETVQSASVNKTFPDFSMEDWTSPSESESEAPQQRAGYEQTSERNEELVRMAFAGDDVFQAFADEKKATMQEEGDQVMDNSLPGWGSWTGAGISKKEKRLANSRKSTTIVKGIDPSSRKDAKLDRVIINEKRCKKNSRYLAPELPHPFESRQQYERSLRLPLGPEWSTKASFQDATKPRVLLKQGIIRPMEKPLV